MIINGLPKFGTTVKTTATRSTGKGDFGLAVKSEQAQRHFDQVSIQTENSMRKELQGRISREVRCATTTGTVAALREAVQAGTYQVDANEIARRMLFVSEV